MRRYEKQRLIFNQCSKLILYNKNVQNAQVVKRFCEFKIEIYKIRAEVCITKDR